MLGNDWCKAQRPSSEQVIPDITHYDIYREAFDESAEMAREWFNGCLKD